MKRFQLIMLAMSSLESAAFLVSSLITAAKQTGELTPGEEAELRLKQQDIMKQDHWQVEPDPKA